MVDLGRLDDFGAAVVEECENIKSYVVVSNEAELKDVMDHVRYYPLLVCVIPQATGDDMGHDNIAERNMGLFYVLKPMKEKMTRQQRMDLWKETQLGMKELKEFIHNGICGDFADMMNDCDFSSREQQPEYQLVDCQGWSLMFSYSTDGL
jgi:hypothetical protein